MAIVFAYTVATNTVVVTGGTSGSPADFASFVTADRAGTGTSLKAATTCAFNMTLTYQVRPVELRAIPIKFIIAGSSSCGTTQNFYPASYNVTTGTVITGSITDVDDDNATYLQIEEAVGDPALDFDFTWSGLPTNYYVEKVHVNGYYDGNPAHDVFIYMWNYNTSGWVRLTAAAQDFPDAAADADYTFDVPSTNRSYYFNAGAAKVRINHTSSGTAGHDFYVDMIRLQRPATNNTLEITGTDAWDAAQTESISVSAGDATYTSTKRWRTITDIDCNGWANGTLAVTQDIWGVIWNLGNNKYQIDSLFNIGDGSAATYFSSSGGQQARFPTTMPNVKTGATCDLGVASGTTYAKQGVCWSFKGQGFTSSFLTYGGTINIYSSMIMFDTADVVCYSGNLLIRDSIIQCNGSTAKAFYAYTSMTSTSYRNVYLNGISYFSSRIAPTLMQTINIDDTTQGVQGYGANTTIIDANVSGVRTLGNDVVSAVNLYLVDPRFHVSAPSITVAGKIIYEQYTCNINVCDKSGVAISGAVVDCENVSGVAVWTTGTVTTDASGNITQQTITYKTWTGTSETLATLTPHKFTISKAGYQTLVLDAITVDSAIKWHLELQPAVVLLSTGKLAKQVTDSFYLAL